MVSGPGAPAAPTDAAGDDLAEFNVAANRVLFRLGTGATGVAGGRVAAGASTSFSFDVRVDDVQPRFEIVNSALASFVSQSLRLPLFANADPVRTVVAAPDLRLSKVHAPEFVAGARSTYRIVVSNIGNLATDGSTVTVTDPLPAAFASIENLNGDGWSCSLGASTITCTRSGALAAGESYPPILVDVTVLDPAPASIVNTATVAGGGDVNPDNNAATDVGGAARAADVSITKTGSPETVLTGETVRFTLVVRNAGASIATAVTVNDPLPPQSYADVIATATTGTCTAAVVCSLGDLAPGESATITIDATVTAVDTTLTNQATVSSTTDDPTPLNNLDAAIVTVAPTADLGVVKTPSTTTPVPGAPGGLTYTITVTNAGPSTATGVTIFDEIPADFAPTAVAGPPGFTCTAATPGATMACSGGSIPSGGAATLTVTGTVAANPSSLTLTNVAGFARRRATRIWSTTPTPRSCRPRRSPTSPSARSGARRPVTSCR